MADASRRYVTLTPDEDARLQARARALGVSEDELIRTAVQQALSGEAPGHHLGDDEQARRDWPEIMALMRARSRLSVPPKERTTGRGWTREDAYAERLDRYAG